MAMPRRGLNEWNVFLESCGLRQLRGIDGEGYLEGFWTSASGQGRNPTGGDACGRLYFTMVTVGGGWTLAVSDPPPFNVGKDPTLGDI